MKNLRALMLVIFSVVFVGCNSISNQDKSEEIMLFNGKNFNNWKGDLKVWSIEDGCIVGRNTNEYKVEQNTFLIHDKEFSNFELTFQYKIIGGNSGVQYRAKIIDEDLYVVGGYQADIEAGINYSGILYEEQGRGILANRGEQIVISENGEKEITEFASSEEIQNKIHHEAWNDYKIIANGNRLQHFINNVKTIDVMDNEADKSANSGIIALQVHAGPNMVVYYKNIKIRPK